MNQVGLKRRQIEIYISMIGLISLLLLGSILNLNGLAYFAAAYECVGVAWYLIGSKTSDTLARMLKARHNKGQYRNIAIVSKYIFICQGLLSLVVGLVLAACAEWIAVSLFHMQYSSSMIVAFAAAFFLRTISSVLLGMFQGEGSEMPALITGILRQTLFLLLGLIGAIRFSDYGEKVSNLLGRDEFRSMYAALGVACALGLTELLLLSGLLFMKKRTGKSAKQKMQEGMKTTDSFGSIVTVFYANMGMDALICVLEWLPLFIGTCIYLGRPEENRVLAVHFGVFAGKYIAICGVMLLPVCAALLVMAARTIGSMRRDEQRIAKALFQSGIHIGVIHGLFLSVFAAVMAEPLAAWFCRTQQPLLVSMLRMGSAIVFLLSLAFYFMKVLLFAGRKLMVLGSLAVVNVVFVLSVFLLTGTEAQTIIAFVYSGVVGSLVGCILLGVFAFRLLHSGMELVQTFGIPAAGTLVCGLVGVLLEKLLMPHLGGMVTVLVALAITGIGYWTILLLTGNVKEQELRMTPFGHVIYYLGHLFHLV
ncbi:MAG: oligosaccharide flippase family protein [Lachnospiraceae bacterium]|nr:oligosaccharide flippase family protein [Lachnospiraceae bacterium]